ncbi:MAG: response regulator transcription factor [Chitinophagales bacterium]|nr:response regulator transcription factor [Chitinophagales bacterium]
MIKLIIIDDSKANRNGLRLMVEHNFPEVFQIDEASGVLDGAKLIRQEQPDIVLLDIQMKDGSGFDLLDSLSDDFFYLIFVTAYKEFAIEAIKQKAYDYLLKPVNPLELIKVLNELITKIQTNKKSSDEEMPSKILVKNQEQTILLNIEDIVYCAAQGAYTEIITKAGRYVSSKNLKHFEKILKSQSFLRVHHSYLVNTYFIKSIERNIQDGLTMINDDKVPIAARRKPAVLKFLNAFN